MRSGRLLVTIYQMRGCRRCRVIFLASFGYSRTVRLKHHRASTKSDRLRGQHLGRLLNGGLRLARGGKRSVDQM